MNVIFAGTPEFARQALDAILVAGFSVPLVLTQPDRPAGRGLKLAPSPVKQLAQTRGVAVAQPRGLRLDGRFAEDAAQARAAIEASQPDVLVVAAYGLILPQWVLDAPRHGCINIHASLLPRWRGAAPIHRAIEAGDPETGVTLMQMDAGLDTGDMLACRRVAIAPDDTTASLHDRLAALGAQMVVEALKQLAHGPLARTPQPSEGVSYARKISKAEARIDWSQPAVVIARRVRALLPAPGAFTQIGDDAIKVLDCEIDSNNINQENRYGHILSVNDAGVTVACGEGSLRLTRLQRAGGRALAARDFVRGHALQPGMQFTSAEPNGAAP
ncbi:methionyl-tRNA formyltransferase [Simplicispira hankyongi]|uniref:Methionyl-tRNA formyltransferase n=1 Tax=Simplicispira hankyongi TaxID=2315688 RepID=A0A398C9H2_9BURK|nr:methionyl-tRNA formyltransferase [Simplicispira hankyongi]RID97737.1 methionyl-tRNA formyltransferase [Simplicispira hankyongi]